MSLASLKEKITPIKELLTKQGFVCHANGWTWDCDKTGAEVIFDMYETASYVEILREGVRKDIEHQCSVKYSISYFQNVMKYQVCKSTSWGYCSVTLATFEEWMEALKFSLRQSDDLLIVQHIRERQQGIIDEGLKKLLQYDEKIAALKQEQKEVDQAETGVAVLQAVQMMSDVIAARAPSNPGPARKGRKSQLSKQPYIVVLPERPQMPHEARKSVAARNLRSRTVAGWP
jgi:hypothetical protein